jgi:hypothetical protein
MLSRFIDLGVEKTKKTRQAQEPRKCQHCDGSMKGVRKDAKFCGNVCRQSAYQSRTYKPKSKPTRKRKTEHAPQVADVESSDHCLNCMRDLFGKERLFCCDACRKQYHRG